ncbi:GAP1-M domain-containing protein [Streptomyces litchfieldiae]|uniref:GTPase-associated protein 1 middle domain-containing protein n=1 Tax=Streptomyces litchfieldiae TaxID=3075543 RepID=A0ABU2MUQ0_9ACTN|nr:hypothetical protein [Streptomyces sp. DSM 44938]MDT0345285.1 hypothetical protein [Streptomyces sp. DSM 44938]
MSEGERHMQGGHVIRGYRFTLNPDPDTELPTATRLAGPEPAPDAPLEPLIAAAAPAPGDSLAFARLPENGGAVVCHTPRAGLVHALHLPGGAAGLPRMWPIDLWRSPTWGADWADGGTAVGPEPGTEFTEEGLADFARARADRLVPFLTDVRRLFGDPAGRQIVVAEAEQATVAWWIALACRFLDGCGDTAHARALTFTTGTHHPRRAPQQILGIGPDADFDRGDPDLLRHRYRVHDGVGGEGSPPEHAPEAVRAVRDWLGRFTGERPPPLPPAPPAPPLDLRARLTRAAAELRQPPRERRDAALYRSLLGLLPDGQPFDADLLTLLYELVWHKADPGPPGALELARTFPPAVLVATRVHLRLTNLLTSSGVINRDRCALARELLAHHETFGLDSVKRTAAELLVRGQDVTAGGPAGAAAAHFLRTELNRQDSLLRPELLAWARHQLRSYELSAGLPPPPERPPHYFPPSNRF